MRLSSLWHQETLVNWTVGKRRGSIWMLSLMHTQTPTTPIMIEEYPTDPVEPHDMGSLCLPSGISINFSFLLSDLCHLNDKKDRISHSIPNFLSSLNLLSKTLNMSQNLTGLGLPGIASNISNIDQCTPALCDIYLWGTVTYVPSLPANAIYAVLFALILCVQMIYVCIYRTWSYSIAMSFGLILEILGYIGRLAMHYNVFNENLFLV